MTHRYDKETLQYLAGIIGAYITTIGTLLTLENLASGAIIVGIGGAAMLYSFEKTLENFQKLEEKPVGENQ